MQLTVAQVAERLGISRQRVSQLIRSGRLRAKKLGPIWVLDSAQIQDFSRLPAGRPRNLR